MAVLSPHQPNTTATQDSATVPTNLDHRASHKSLSNDDMEKLGAKQLLPSHGQITASQRSHDGISISIEDAVRKLKITELEAQKLQNIRSLEELQKFVAMENSDHQQRRGTTNRGKFQDILIKFNEFGNAYGSILNGLKEAVPHSGGQVAWALLGGLFLIAHRKDSREKAIAEFLSRLRYSLPRSHRNRELYQNSSTIVALHQHLHQVVIESLLKACIYFRDKGWAGTFSRISSAMSIHDDMADLFDEVAMVSAEIDAESMLELRTEVRVAHEETSETKKEAEKMSMHLVEVRKELSLVNEQLRAANQHNAELKQKLKDIHAQKVAEQVAKLKPALVPSTYSANAIVSKCQQQIRCPTKRRQQLHQLMATHAFQQWEASTDQSTTNLVWITDKRRADSSISIVPLSVIDRHAGSDLVLHSLYQYGTDISLLPHNSRTATTIVREAIYQVLSQQPDSWLRYGPNTNKNVSFEDLVNQLVISLDSYCNDNPNHTETTVYWIIDRVETVFWKTFNTALGLSDTPPQSGDLDKAERAQVARASVTLDKFLEQLQIIINSSTKGTATDSFEEHGIEGKKRTYKRQWKLKVLVSSHYSVHTLRRSHGIEEDLQWDTRKWVDLMV